MSDHGSNRDSDISDGGLPNEDLDYVVSNGLAEKIEKRRELRRLLKAKTRIDYGAIVSVLHDVNSIYSQN